jgi:hypothetical protein
MTTGFQATRRSWEEFNNLRYISFWAPPLPATAFSLLEYSTELVAVHELLLVLKIKVLLHFLRKSCAGHWWFTPVSPKLLRRQRSGGSWFEASPGTNSSGDPISKKTKTKQNQKTYHNKGLVEWLKLHQLSKCAALSSNPSAMKNKKVLQ